jgi:hypothetical protein
MKKNVVEGLFNSQADDQQYIKLELINEEKEQKRETMKYKKGIRANTSDI